MLNIFDCRYGWSRARYVYSLISGVGIFFLGSGVSVYHGISDLFNPPVLASLPLVGYCLHHLLYFFILCFITTQVKLTGGGGAL